MERSKKPENDILIIKKNHVYQINIILDLKWDG